MELSWKQTQEKEERYWGRKILTEQLEKSTASHSGYLNSKTVRRLNTGLWSISCFPRTELRRELDFCFIQNTKLLQWRSKEELRTPCHLWFAQVGLSHAEDCVKSLLFFLLEVSFSFCYLSSKNPLHEHLLRDSEEPGPNLLFFYSMSEDASHTESRKF